MSNETSSLATISLNNRTITIGDLVIANEADRPCTRFICEVVGFQRTPTHPDDWTALCQYVAKASYERMPNAFPAALATLTPIREFGIRAQIIRSAAGYLVITGEPDGSVSTAHYLSGEPRLWFPEAKETHMLQFGWHHEWIVRKQKAKLGARTS